MKSYIFLGCLLLTIPFLTDWMVDREFAKHPPLTNTHHKHAAKQPTVFGYDTGEASELQRLQDAAVKHRMTSGEKREALIALGWGRS